MKSERTIYKWQNGEIQIPEERVQQILVVAKIFAIPVAQLRDETDLFLLAMNDPDRF